MYMRTGFLIISFGILFISRFTFYLDEVIQTYNPKSSPSIFYAAAYIVKMISFYVIWLAIYVLFFEVQRIKITIEAESHSELKRSIDAKNKFNRWLFGVYCIIVVAKIGVHLSIFIR